MCGLIDVAKAHRMCNYIPLISPLKDSSSPVSRPNITPGSPEKTPHHHLQSERTETQQKTEAEMS